MENNTKILDKMPEILLDWFYENRREFPWRQNRTPYGTWVSETMLQQTRARTVISYYHHFLDLFPDIPSLAGAKQEDVYKAWEGLGYYSRARNLHEGAAFCVEHFAGKLPQNMSDLLLVPGIGPYTAGAIASLAFGKDESAVDGNVIRVFSRLFAIFVCPTDVQAKKEITSVVREYLPTGQAGDFNEAVMDLGATICTPGIPHCKDCPLSLLCQANLLDIASKLPVRRVKKDIPTFSYTIVVLTYEDKIYISRRPTYCLLANLNEFISLPGLLSEKEIQEWVMRVFAVTQMSDLAITKLENSSHVFPHLRWEMIGYHVKIKEKTASSSLCNFRDNEAGMGAFFQMEDARKLAFPSALKAYTRCFLLSK